MVHSVHFCPAEGTKLGVFGLIPKLEHVQAEIARETGIDEACVTVFVYIITVQ